MRMAKVALACALLGLSYTASADHWHSKHHRHHNQKYEYWDGHCKVKREYKKNGRYKEKRDCKPKGHPHAYRSKPPRHSGYGVSIPAIIIEPVIRIGG